MVKRRAERGLTLLEVLICICVVLILALMILPAINSGSGAHSIHCLSNQRQLGIAALMYEGDGKKGFPNLDSSPGDDGPVALSFLTNYLAGRTNLFMCSLVVRQRERDRGWFGTKFVPELNAAFFRSNGNDYAYYDGVPPNSPTNAFIADRFAWTNGSTTNLREWNHPNGNINAVFVDGHGERLRPECVVGDYYTPMWSAQQDPRRR